jgi:hypothetical protein
MKATGYSLWLMPEEGTPSHASLSGLIERLAKIAGSPVFPPHVTVLGGIEKDRFEVLSRSEMITTFAAPFEVRLGKIGSECEYFRGFFSEVVQDKEIMEINKRSSIIHGMDKDFFPHLSLSYFDYSEDTLALLKEAIDGIEMSHFNFMARSLVLYQTEGDVREWKPVFNYPFFR